jgi:hypothetical protein
MGIQIFIDLAWFKVFTDLKNLTLRTYVLLRGISLPFCRKRRFGLRCHRRVILPMIPSVVHVSARLCLYDIFPNTLPQLLSVADVTFLHRDRLFAGHTFQCLPVDELSEIRPDP